MSDQTSRYYNKQPQMKRSDIRRPGLENPPDGRSDQDPQTSLGGSVSGGETKGK